MKTIVEGFFLLEDVGHFNTLNMMWNVDSTPTKMDIVAGEIYHVKVESDPKIPGGLMSTIVHQETKASTVVLGNVIQDRNSKTYVMKNDRYRMQWSKPPKTARKR